MIKYIAPLGFLVFLLLKAGSFLTENTKEISLTVNLRDGQAFPKLGLAVENLDSVIVAKKLPEARDVDYMLVETSHTSKNDEGIREGIKRWRDARNQVKLRGGNEGGDTPDEFHVMAKIEYTHYGYERTKLAIQEIEEAYFGMQVKIHILLHFPRCRDVLDSLEECAKEEEALSDEVKQAGPPPHNARYAFLDSWQALEEAYLEHDNDVASIGVSHFDLHDLQILEKSARIMPHILQGSARSVILNPEIIQHCRDVRILYQIDDVMNGIVNQQAAAPLAWDAVGKDSSYIFQWFVQQDVSIVSNAPSNLLENSPLKLAELTPLSPKQIRGMTAAVTALIKGEDQGKPIATFTNQHSEKTHIYWDSGEEEIPVRMDLQPGDSFVASTFPGHKFIVYDSSKEKRLEFEINATYGEEEFHMEL